MPQKTLVRILDDYNHPYPSCPNCSSNNFVIRSGTRSVQDVDIQLYFCKTCLKRYSDSNITRTSYPPRPFSQHQEQQVGLLMPYPSLQTNPHVVASMRRRTVPRYVLGRIRNRVPRVEYSGL